MPDGLSGGEQAIYFSKVRKFFDSYACSRVMGRRKKMSDYIERQKVKDIRFSGGINHDGFLYVPYKELVDGIKALPPADVVQVVRCKDCRYAKPYEWMYGFGEVQSTNIADYDWDEVGCSKNEVHFSPDDFCSYGEREE